jgi:hypothetical protein
MSTTLDVNNITRHAGPVFHQHGHEVQPFRVCTWAIGGPMATTGNCSSEDSPAGEEPKDSARVLVAVISGVGTVLSLAFLVGDLVHHS